MATIIDKLSLHKASTAQQQIINIYDLWYMYLCSYYGNTIINNSDYSTGLSDSWWVGKKRAWYPLFVHAHKFSEILGNWELYIMLHLPYTVCTSSDQQRSSFNRLLYFTIPRPPVFLI